MSLEPKPVDATAKQAADAKASLLLRKSEDSYAFPVLDSVGNQFARSLRDLIRALGAPTVQVDREAAVPMRFADWCQAVSPGLFWRYHAPPLKGPLLLAATHQQCFALGRTGQAFTEQGECVLQGAQMALPALLQRRQQIQRQAGKGHEQGQTVGSTVHPFDDVAEVAAALEAKHV